MGNHKVTLEVGEKRRDSEETFVITIEVKHAKKGKVESCRKY